MLLLQNNQNYQAGDSSYGQNPLGDPVVNATGVVAAAPVAVSVSTAGVGGVAGGALGFAKDNDSNANGASDILEFYNTRLKEFDIQTKANMDAARMQNEQQKMYNEQLNMKQKAVSEREKMDNEQLLMDKKLAQAKVLGDKKK